MRIALRCLPLLLAAVCVCLASPVRAENEGQDDYSRAMEKRLSSESLADLSEAIDLFQSALKKGLAEDDAKTAKLFLTSVLLQRAEFRTKLILSEAPTNWPRLRQQSLEDLEQALKNDSKLAQAHLLMARLQSIPPGDRVAAEKAAEKAAEFAGDDQETKVTSLVLLANLTAEPAKKLEYINQAVKIAPTSNEVLRTRGLLLLAMGKPDDAIADLQMLVKSDPKNTESRNELGLALLLLNRDDEAVEQFSAAIEQAPDEPRWFVNRARVYLQSHRFGKALEDLDQTLKLAPGNPLVLLLRARANQGAGNLDAAKTDLETVMKDIHGMPPEALAILSFGSENLNQAVADLEELAKLVPNNSQLLSQLGLFYLANKQPHKAIEKSTTAIEKDPENFIALRTRADALLSVGKHADAVADYEKAIKLRPRDQGVLNNLAWVLATSPHDDVRNADRSIELSTQACKATDYRKAHILSTLAAGYAEAGDWEKAVEWSKKAVELGHDDAETAEQLKKELANYEAKKPWREKQELQDETPPQAEGKDKSDAPPGDAAAKKE